MRLLPCTLLAVVLLVVGGCDPGFEYRPVGWERVDRFEWRTELDGVKVKTGVGLGLIADRTFGTEFDFENMSTAPVIVEGADLITAERRYAADLPGDGELRWRRVEPSNHGRVHLGWDFENYTTDALGHRPRIVLALRIGEEQHELEIEYERVE